MPPAALKDEFVNIAERSFGEEFLKLSEMEGMSNRYRQSLKLTRNDNKVLGELDYRGEDDEPLGVWFEKGTGRHYIAPIYRISLSWIQNGIRFFSKGHWVSGITPRRIMERTLIYGRRRFREEVQKLGNRKYKI